MSLIANAWLYDEDNSTIQFGRKDTYKKPMNFIIWKKSIRHNS
jgi:hypothetical protein